MDCFEEHLTKLAEVPAVPEKNGRQPILFVAVFSFNIDTHSPETCDRYRFKDVTSLFKLVLSLKPNYL